jgi:hypothetical protein
MRRALVPLAALLLLRLGTSVAQPQSATYEQLLTRAKAGDPGVDYQALRYSYAATPGFNPYGGAATAHTGAMMKAFKAGDCPNVVKEAAEVLDVNYTNIDAHMLSDLCYSRMGDDAQRAQHHATAAALLRSIASSGDGKSEGTAYVVIAVEEEYSLLSALGTKPKRQALIQGDGHMFDRIDVTTSDGQTQAVFFNIDRVFAAYNQLLQQKRQQSPQP